MMNFRQESVKALDNFLREYPNAAKTPVATGETTKTHMLYTSDAEVLVEETENGFKASHPAGKAFSALLVHADYSSNGQVAVTGREDHGHQLFKVEQGDQLNYFRQQAYNPATGLFREVRD